MHDDRRTGPPTRRHDELVDWRLSELERAVERHDLRLDAVEVEIVPRSEHERRHDRSRDWTLRLTMLALAAGQIYLAARGGR